MLCLGEPIGIGSFLIFEARCVPGPTMKFVRKVPPEAVPVTVKILHASDYKSNEPRLFAELAKEGLEVPRFIGRGVMDPPVNYDGQLYTSILVYHGDMGQAITDRERHGQAMVDLVRRLNNLKVSIGPIDQFTFRLIGDEVRLASLVKGSRGEHHRCSDNWRALMACPP